MKGVIAAGDRLTAQAGADILKKGGNAFDATCASMLAAPLCEPMLTSLGGGGFALTHEAKKAPVLYDFFVDVPPNRAENPDFFPIYVDFGNTVQEFHIGAASTAIPGMVKGIYQLHAEKGSLPLEEIIKPACRYAGDGIYLSKTQAGFIKMLEPLLASTEASREVFLKNGRLIDEKHLFRDPDYAGFLESFADKGGDIFYSGEVADAICELNQKEHGHLRKSDLERYEVIKREPIVFTYKNDTILTNPPPSAGGILIAFALKLLDGADLGKFGSLKHIRELVESMAITADFRSTHINEHLHKTGLENILDDEKQLSHYLLSKSTKLNLWGNTTHISVIDEHRNAVSVTTTNGEGSGLIVPGAGIMLNNMLGEEDLNPHGFFKWKSGIRLPSMMAPTIVMENEIPKLVLGSAGSNRIRSAISEVIVNHICFGQNIQDSINAPRVHFEKGNLFFEPDFNIEVIKEAEKLYKTEVFEAQSIFFGGVNAVTGDFKGGSDSRRGGSVIHVQ
ncbi:MAG: gamma-glutamyltransferase [Helicobacteraceae bacterium 4484_230]|nr:MAG: gamma-glutamyltransferase [Helicobacteraceae bacterium 4484_230]